MKKSTVAYFLVFFILLGIIFRNWLLSPNIIGGDWPFFFQDYVNHFSWFPPIWNSAQGNGLGGQSLVYATDSYLYFTGWFFSVILHLPWTLVYKIVWFGLFLVLSVSSAFFLVKTIFPKSLLWQRLLAALIYTTNTYILLVVGGGQMGVALSYAIAPLVLSKFIKVVDNASIKLSLVAGLLFAIQVMFDFRFAYITFAAAVLYLLVSLRSQSTKNSNLFKTIVYALIIPLGVTAMQHTYWILPLLAVKTNPVASLGSAYTSLSSVKYFSFASFENALGLLHPYWPENIFGKVSFMKPEYLLFPIMAFASIFFIKNAKSKIQNKKYILFFALLGILGVFFTKGANDPFGNVYLWMFDHVPGFILFRDPMKWYTLIAISYAVLIPITIYSVYEFLNTKFKLQKFTTSLFLILFVFFWLFTIRQAVFGQLSGTFARHEIPNEYVLLKNRLVSDTHFGRTLWIPRLQRFGYYDQTHPFIEGVNALGATTSADMVKVLKKKNEEQMLSDSSIKYLIVPYDSEKELFLKDRKYNDKERQSIISQLQTIPWLTRDDSFKNLIVFTLKSNKDRFWMRGNRKITWQKVSNTEYHLKISSGSAENLIFDEAYNSSWIAVSDGKELTNKKFGLFNSFIIPLNKKDMQVILTYSLSKYFIIGRIVSLITLIVVICLLFFTM